MKQPSVFISSTIYDFADLRSSLKYWLKEMGFDAQLSEHNDFKKDLTINSYDACLQSIAQCDYFVLLLGTRRGGMYPGEDISITRKEYRTAYELAKIGKIKKLIIFIRQSVWDVREDRKSLHKFLNNITVLENDLPADTRKIENHNSAILKDAEHIIGFLDEVTRKEDSRNGDMPSMNWVHTFNSYEDIINTLKIELRVTHDISIRIAEQNIKMAVTHTLQKITYKTEMGRITAFYLPFQNVRNKLKQIRDNARNFSGTEIVSLTTEEVDSISNFILFYYTGVDELTTYEFENILSSGVLMDYDFKKETPTYNNFCRMIYQIIEEINRLKKFVQDFSPHTQQKMLDTIRNYSRKSQAHYDFEFLEIGQLSSIFERLYNIQTISFYLINCIDSNDMNLRTPTILNGFVNMGRPSESDILRVINLGK